MKVMHLLDSLNRGGAEMLALDVCRHAAANDLDLTFVATGGGDLEQDFRNSGARFIRLERRLPVDLRLAVRLRRIITERQIDIVHSHQAVEGLHANLATRGMDVKRVMSFHLCTADAKNRMALKFLVPRMDANIAVSRDLLNCLTNQAKLDTDRNFHVIYNGVDSSRLKPTDGNLRAELGLASNNLLLGMVGNFYADRRKDQLTVCQALPRFFDAAPSAHFIFVGGPDPDAPQEFNECLDYCRERGISDRVHFLGKRADIPDVLHALDVFVFSSRGDSFGVAVVEAMMAGVPAVVSDIAPLREVTADGAYAVIFRAGDADDLAQRLIELIDDKEGRTALGEHGREWAMQQFSIETHIANLLKLYDEVAHCQRD